MSPKLVLIFTSTVFFLVTCGLDIQKLPSFLEEMWQNAVLVSTWQKWLAQSRFLKSSNKLRHTQSAWSECWRIYHISISPSLCHRDPHSWCWHAVPRPPRQPPGFVHDCPFFIYKCAQNLVCKFSHWQDKKKAPWKIKYSKKIVIIGGKKGKKNAEQRS